ncbi:pyridoxamine 5'-phosphate oxidase family protein [Agromyces salentinus]|uniref:Pyridoxamine 5'-phosphate oxidase family protein n=1 Tax=Agromyces salentinus TaxID=269421 RepID=A0ABN2MGM3_9MICO|nr:pyridoxamine 5'-phosphate oxidase family protein [Agromyces salentinus]
MDRSALVDYVRERGDAVVSTVGPDGAPQSAYLSITATDSGELVFNARGGSRKIANLRRDPRIAIVVGGIDKTTVQAQGRADVLEPGSADAAPYAEAYGRAFPWFAESLAKSEYELVRVQLDWARFGDYRSGPPVSVEVELS